MSYQEQLTKDMGQAIDESLQTTDIFTTAKKLPEISEFVRAIELAGLAMELSSPDVLRTLFAPVNDALEKAPNHFWKELHSEENRERLVQILHLHLVHGRQTEADLRTASTLKSFDGEPVSVEYRAEGSKFGGAHIIRRDISCQNGTIHLIDKLVVREYPYAG